MKENDIRPTDLMKQKEPALLHDINYLKSKLPDYEIKSCPACESNELSKWDEKNSFTYDQCNICKTIFMNPRPNEKILEDFYRQSKNYEFWAKHIFPASDRVRKEKIFKPRAKKTTEILTKYGRKSGGIFLEIGAAYGTFCEAIREENIFDEIIALELTPDLSEICRKKGFKTLEDPVEKLSLPINSVDVAASFEVIEHLANPNIFVRKISYIIKKDGFFICTCPNGESVGMMELGAYAREVDHEHLNYFNPKSLSLLMESSGFEVLEVTTPGQLDVDLLKNIIKSGDAGPRGGGFFKHLAFNSTSEIETALQDFIVKSKLSSHMWIVCRKK